MIKLHQPTDASNRKPAAMARRILAIALPVLVYSVIFPSLLFIFPKYYLDQLLNLPTFLNPVFRAVLGIFLIVPGSVFSIWSINAQIVHGKGSPMPLLPTQKLIIQGPYSYCRNPIYFGLINVFFGISILIGSLSSLLFVCLFFTIILMFVKAVEEKELEKRFGEKYLANKHKIPFIIPRLTIQRKKRNEINL